MNKLVKGVASVLFSSVSGIIIGLIYQPLLARIAGIELYGEIATLIAWYGILQVVFNLGMFDSVRKYVSNYINNKNDDILVISLILPVFIGLVMFLIMAIILNILKGIMVNEYIYFFYIIGLSLVFTNAWIAVKSIMYSFHKEDTFVKYDILSRIIDKGLVILFVIIGYNIFSLAYALLITGIVNLIIAIFLWNKYIDCKLNIKQFFQIENIILIKEILKFGSLSITGILSAQILYKSDILLIKYFLGNSYTGIYKVGLTLAEQLWLVPKAVQSVIFHNSSEYWGQNKIRELTNIFNKSLKYTYLFLVLAGGGLFVLAKPFISLIFGPEYSSAVLPLQILIVGTFGFGIARIFLSTFSATSWIKVSQTITIIVTLINIIMNYFLIPVYGIIGAAIATSFTYFLMLIFSIYYYYNNDVKFVVEFDYKRGIALLLSFSSLFYLINYFMVFESLLYIGFSAILGLLLFALLSFVFGLLSKRELFGFIKK